MLKDIPILNNLLDQFLTEPKRLIKLGQFLLAFGASVLLVGLFGQVATTAIGALEKLGSRTAGAKMLSDLYPSLPTWWIPESIGGAIIPAILVVLGLWLIQAGKQFVRAMEF
ncbi:MAG: hypothetical protein Q7U97_08150 [Rhodocyclaceae bacterium]|nr:hypothetical protein [Rhodocyclaceae bacterium]